ncbi:hypothetical protein [Runella sp.]|jgi:hypothetical protein|uniref:hypothetical protein n=1 Tax=Runella sp. TaxID=1960881 RepID=UPI002614E20D|nr:hypothetical protein [Runella sp.]
MSITEAFGDVATMVAQMNPEKVVALKASRQMSEEVEKLVMLKKQGTISVDEAADLERFLALDLFISLAKARAHILLVK